MKILTPIIFSLIFGGFVYAQAFNVSVDMLKDMDKLMKGAATQLNTIDTPASLPTQKY
jgi:hypothetical protein